MITLYGSNPGFGLPEVSPYVTKTEIQLMLLGLPYRKLTAAPADSPKGQIPFIDEDGTRIGDSTFIRAHLEQKHGLDLDAGLDERQRAEAWAIERMVENHFGWTTAYARWVLPENFAKGPAHFFDHAPEAVRDKLRADVQERVRANLHAVGVGRHTEEEIVQLGVRSLRALAALLGDKPFMMGGKPTGVDAIVFAMLAGIATPFFDSPLRREVLRFEKLCAYVDRLMARFYPQHAWQPLVPPRSVVHAQVAFG